MSVDEEMRMVGALPLGTQLHPRPSRESMSSLAKDSYLFCRIDAQIKEKSKIMISLQNYIDAGKIIGFDKNAGLGTYQKILFRNADLDYFLQNDKRN